MLHFICHTVLTAFFMPAISLSLHHLIQTARTIAKLTTSARLNHVGSLAPTNETPRTRSLSTLAYSAIAIYCVLGATPGLWRPLLGAHSGKTRLGIRASRRFSSGIVQISGLGENDEVAPVLQVT